MYKFFEVFTSLRLPEDIRDYFEEAEVIKVAKTSTNTLVKVYLKSSRLIHKHNIYKAEEALKKQIFRIKNMNVRIIDRYELSQQYSPKKIMNIYYDSILFELEKYWTLEYSLLKTSKWVFEEEDKLVLILEDSFLAQTYAEDLKSYFEKVFLNRFGYEIDVLYRYVKKAENQYAKENEYQLKLRVKAIEDYARKSEQSNNGDNGGNSFNGDNSKYASNSNNSPHTKDTMNSNDSANLKNAANQVNQSNTGNILDDLMAGNEMNGSNHSSSSNTSMNKDIQLKAEKKSSSNGTKATMAGNYNGGKVSKGSYDSNAKSYKRRQNNPDVLYGRDFEEEVVPIDQIVSEMGEVVIEGQIRFLDMREIRNEKTIIMYDITDFKDTITVKMFAKNDQLPELLEFIKKGNFLKIKGIVVIDKYDKELTMGSVTGIRKSSDTRGRRNDLSLNKRVELHCHTKMSDMDGVSYAGDIIKQAIRWGHRAIAITDHGNVQGFTEAFHKIRDIEGDYKKRGETLDFKVIYGLEAYLVDDIKEMVVNSRNQSLDDSYVVFDLETTGFNAEGDQIIEIGAVKVVNEEIVDRYSTFVNPEVPIPFKIEKLTGINDSMVIDAPKIQEILPMFLEFCADSTLVAHNAEFDLSFVTNKASKMGIEVHNTVVDTLSIARFLLPNLHNFKLDTLAKHFCAPLHNHHRAVDDAEATSHIFINLCRMLKDRDIFTLDELNERGEFDEMAIRKLPSFHAIILTASEVGRVNLYRLVSASNLQFFNKRPKIPKSMFDKYREGLILGTACEAGELYQAILKGQSENEIARLVNYYDYLEIQPRGNNKFMFEKPEIPVNSNEDLIEINKKIVKLGERFNKLVVATCDVHFLNPEDEVYRRIIMAGKGFSDADDQAPLYLRTTEEMLQEFDYLGPDKAEEVVVTNTNKIMELCDKIEPVRRDKCPPIIENSDQTLREICYKRAYELYGETLPEIVTERLERELNSIISNGYSVMYIIAQKLVWKSNDDGYLVGSRGSVGSSFVATMAGITEVNPLSPHYLCSKCFYSDFESEEVIAFSGGAGCDMPDKICPVCGEKLKKEGFDIPFETFLGFKGNKEPDIDLNFSGEYQSKAHAYTEVIFGKGQTFKAGTIGTLAEKTAYGYVKNYYLERGQDKRNCEINRIVEGCVDVRKTTGQHPGGIMVLPIGEEIHSFTPIQHPANDMTTNIITTHFDYHSIDHNLLKLDILGHDDPTMIRMLQDLTGVNPLDIPLDSKEVMSLFKDTSVLKILPEDIGGCKIGALGIPEFGTDFAMQMLIDTKPKYFSDLVRIAGLSHGTDVWLGNAQTLLQEGKATISTAICTRDDIMIYLIHMGMDAELSFTIMEAVRKGKGLKPEWEELMIAADVPDWYIWSCKKIKYMFPKAHAAAYVMMAWRIAYCKVFYPLAYYCAYFSIRANGFSYEIMCMGKETLERYLKDYKARNELKLLTPKEETTLKDMRIVQEFYARGFEFMAIDLFKVKAKRFQIIDHQIMPALTAIDGLGENASESIEIASIQGSYLSKEDFKQRAKIGKTVADLMDSLGILGNMPETNQLSLFDL